MPPLEEETWGDRLKRARDKSGLTLEQAAARVATVVPVSYGALAGSRGRRSSGPCPAASHRAMCISPLRQYLTAAARSSSY